MNEPQRLLRMLLKTPTSLLWTPDSSDNKEKADALIFSDSFSTLLGDHTGRIVWKSDAASAPIFRPISAQRPEAEHPTDMRVSHVMTSSVNE